MLSKLARRQTQGTYQIGEIQARSWIVAFTSSSKGSPLRTASMQAFYKSNDKSLLDRVIIVTGGGRGLGREMALSLVASGARVVITGARAKQELDQVVQEANTVAERGRCMPVLANATVPADCERTATAALDAFGSIYGLINNAGRGMRLISETFNTEPTKFWEADPEAWRTIIDTNVNGAFQMARAVAPVLIERGAGMIVNISTSPVTMVRRGYSPYGPSKAALEACSASWARDLEGTGVCVNVLLPGGATDTALLPGSGPGRRGADGQLLDPRIMAPPAVWLCSDDARRYSGRRFVAKHWKPEMRTEESVLAALQPAVESPAIT